MHCASQGNAGSFSVIDVTPIFCNRAVAAEEIARAIEQTPVIIERLVIRDDSKGLARDTGNLKVIGSEVVLRIAAERRPGRLAGRFHG